MGRYWWFVWVMWLAACSSKPTPKLDETDCRFRLHSSQEDGVTTRCGMLHTFAEYDHPTPELPIQVPFLLFRRTPNQATDRAVVYLAGGPGQSWGNLGLEHFDAERNLTLAYDVIFAEQRGAGLAVPHLECGRQKKGEDDEAFINRCRQDLAGKGFPLAAFNTVELAHDVLQLQRLLGYKTIILVGVSYGTAWALEIMRQAHGEVAGAILDSVVTPDIPPLSRSASAQAGALDALFKACDADLHCASGGDLRATFDSVLQTLKDQPTLLPFGPRDAFDNVLHMLNENPGATPAYIRHLRDALLSPTRASENLRWEWAQPSKVSLGQYLSVMCSDNQHVTDEQIAADLQTVPENIRAYVTDARRTRAWCEKWPYQSRPPPGPVQSEIPTLLLAGSFDWRTPPDWARAAAKTLSSSTLVVVEGVGHDVGAVNSECLAHLQDQFIQVLSPGGTGCAALLRPQFGTAPARQWHLLQPGDLDSRLPTW